MVLCPKLDEVWMFEVTDKALAKVELGDKEVPPSVAPTDEDGAAFVLSDVRVRGPV